MGQHKKKIFHQIYIYIWTCLCLNDSNDWKEAWVVPIFTKGDSLQTTNQSLSVLLQSPAWFWSTSSTAVWLNIVLSTTHTHTYTLWFCCQANSKAPKIWQVSPYATCNSHSCLLFYLWTDTLWNWCYSLEKFNCRGGCVVLSAVHKAEVPQTEQVDKFLPCHPMCLAQWNDGKISLMSLQYQ